MSGTYIILPPNPGIDDNWRVLPITPSVDDPAQPDVGDPLPVVPYEPVLCAAKKIPAIGEVIDTWHNSATNEITLFFFSRITRRRYEISGYKESETETVEIVASQDTPSGTTTRFASQAGKWTSFQADLQHYPPSNEVSDGYYWYYAACDITGKFSGSDAPNQVFRNVGEGWQPCFHAGSIVQPEFSDANISPNVVNGWIEQTAYWYSALTLIADIPGGIIPPFFPGEPYSPPFLPSTGDDGGKRKVQGDETSNQGVARVQCAPNYQTNYIMIGGD